MTQKWLSGVPKVTQKRSRKWPESDILTPKSMIAISLGSCWAQKVRNPLRRTKKTPSRVGRESQSTRAHTKKKTKTDRKWPCCFCFVFWGGWGQSSYPAEVRKWKFSPFFSAKGVVKFGVKFWWNFPRYVFQGLGVRRKISPKFHIKNGVENENFTQVSLCWGAALTQPGVGFFFPEFRAWGVAVLWTTTRRSQRDDNIVQRGNHDGFGDSYRCFSRGNYPLEFNPFLPTYPKNLSGVFFCFSICWKGLFRKGVVRFAHSKPLEPRKPQDEDLKQPPSWYYKFQYFEELQNHGNHKQWYEIIEKKLLIKTTPFGALKYTVIFWGDFKDPPKNAL